MKWKLLAAALLAVVSAQAQIFIPGYDELPADEQPEWFPAPEPVNTGREFPRTRTLSYDSEEASLEGGSGESLYIQPLEGQWQKNAGEGYTEYTRNFKFPFAWIEREAYLYIGSAPSPYEIIVNDATVGFNQSYSTPGEFNVTAYSKEGMNTLTVKLYDNAASKQLTEGTAESFPAGDTYINAQPKVRIRDYTVNTTFEGTLATVELGVIMKTQLLNTKSVHVHYRLLGPEGDEVALGRREAELSRKSEDTVRFLISVPSARQWTHESPETYTLLLRTQHEGRYTEYVKYDLGLRSVSVVNGRLHINGKELPLSVTTYGERLDSASTASRLATLKHQGYNMLKLSGAPQPEYFYRLCDRLGIYICNQADINTGKFGESRAIDGNPSNDPIWNETYTDRALTMYYSSKNHPSVIMFSVAAPSANGFNLYESYLAVKNVEKERPVVYSSEGEWNSDAVTPPVAVEFPTSVNGRLVIPDESAAVIRNVSPVMELTDTEKGTYRITNNADVTTLEGRLVYTVKQGTKKVSEGIMSVSVYPGETRDFDLPQGEAKPGKKKKFDVRLESNLNR